MLASSILEIKENHMIGITLGVEQIRNAPAQVRQWIEQQVSGALGCMVAAMPQPPHLTACTQAQAATVLERIRNLPSVVAVFFEFARPGICYGEPSVMAFRLIDIQRLTRLETVTRLLECLGVINQAFAEVCDDPAARFCDFDNLGHCLILPDTHSSIAVLLEEIVAAKDGEVERAA
jgi:hypothetical protein